MKREFIYKPVCGSTNSELKAAVRASASPVTAVLRAGAQTGGRGRDNKTFFSPAGGLYFSAAFPLTGEETHISFLTLLAGLAACRALESTCPAPYLIKWPNDIYLNGKKLCGILTELVSAGGRLTAVVGFGINTGTKTEEIPPQLKSVMTSLSAEGLRRPDDVSLLKTTLSLLDHYVYDLAALRGNTAPFAKELNARSFLAGKTVTADTGSGAVTGRVKEIGPTGLLVLETAGGRAEILSGTITVVGRQQAAGSR